MYYKKPDNWLEHWDFLILDTLFLQAAYIVSCVLRNGLKNPYESQTYLDVGIMICYTGICAIFFMDGHKEIMKRNWIKELKSTAKYVGSVLAVEAAYLFLTKRGESFSRMAFLVFGILALWGVFLERVFWKKISRKWKAGSGSQRGLLLFAESKNVHAILQSLKSNDDNAIKVVGVVLADSDDKVGEVIENTRVVCQKDAMLTYIRTNWVDEILICAKEDGLQEDQFAERCIEMGVTVHRQIAEVAENLRQRQIERIGNYVVMSFSARFVSWKQMALKRVIDICGALVGLLFTGVIAVFLCPAIYLASPGPVLFSQIRVGKNGRRFRIYKFRSMYLDAEERKKELLERNKMKGCMFKVDADPRIIGSGKDGTRRGLGWFIRKLSIDEFPQFWNVLRGEMSLVGTRPPTLDEWEHYDLHHRARLAVKPGLTGIWQVSGRSNVVDFEEVVRMDKEYIQTWSIGLDIRIILKTMLVVLTGQGAK